MSWQVWKVVVSATAKTAVQAFGSGPSFPSAPHQVTSTPDAALAAARRCPWANVKPEDEACYGQAVVVKAQAGPPRWFLWRGEVWGVDEDGKLGGRP